MEVEVQTEETPIAVPAAEGSEQQQSHQDGFECSLASRPLCFPAPAFRAMPPLQSPINPNAMAIGVVV
jgi:hypothetical protein